MTIRRPYLLPTWLTVFFRYGRIGFLSLLYLRRRLEEEGLYPHPISDGTILALIRSRQEVWYKPMRWTGGIDDDRMHSPEGVKTWLDMDICDFKNIIRLREDLDDFRKGRLSHSHAIAALRRSNRGNCIPSELER